MIGAMGAASRPVSGKIVGAAAGPLSAAQLMEEIVSLVKEWAYVHETETTKRSQIQASANVTVAEIHARRELFISYLDRTFDERERAFEHLFEQLDRAMDRDIQVVGQILSSITTLALKSPFAELRDPVKLRSMIDDPDTHWEV